MPVRTYWYIEHKGNQMAEAVLRALPGIATAGDVDVRVAGGRFDYPLRTEYPVSVEEAEREVELQKSRLAEFEKDPQLSATRRADAVRVDLFQAEQMLRTARRFFSGQERPATRSLEQMAVGIGDAVFVTFPGELFSEIGLAIKEASPVEKTFVIGVTCGPGGYLPTAKEFLEGDYEVNGSAYSPATEKFCVESSLSLIQRVATK
jgi:neutral ceramidase